MNRKFFKIKHLYLLLVLIIIANHAVGSNGEMPSVTAASEKVVFSEVLYDSDFSGESKGEWIELYNPQSTTVDIGGWTISDNTGSFKIPSGTTIGSKMYIVIANSNYGLSCGPDVMCDIAKLNNTGDYLILKNSGGTIIDQVAWESGGSSIPGWGSTTQPYAGEGKTIRRINPDSDTDRYSDWISNRSPDPNCGGNVGGGGGGGGGGQDGEPFGQFATPIDNSTVYGSIAVTGWALDDVGIESLKIYRKDGSTSVYIGDAVFVEGARPDVQVAYPGYPDNHKAGWGYMLLTNFLPNSGNGTFVLEAKAKDTSGNEVTIGSKTIICDNANAVKPFGAIDSPTQGGTASGSTFINWGWVLTPQPNSIPTDGSTINVWVDGVNLGHPVYNIYRNDIATFFPGYANTNGAIGYFYLDTTGYTDGVHSIYWTATDSGGNSDGIGSRYFKVQNSSQSLSNAQGTSLNGRVVGQTNSLLTELRDIPINDFDTIRIRRGIRADREFQPVTADEYGAFSIQMEEMERVELQLSREPSITEGYMMAGDRLMPLPIGSTLEAETGRFHWWPGPGFIGEYRLVFVERTGDGWTQKKEVVIRIGPKGAEER